MQQGAGLSNNEDTVLRGLDLMVELFQGLSGMSAALFSPGHAFPDVFAAFRNIFDSSEKISRQMQKFESGSNQFQREKEELIDQHIELILKVTEDLEEWQRRWGQKSWFVPEERAVALQQQLLALNRLIEANNQDFHIQIANYNNHLYDLKQRLQDNQLQLERTRNLEVVIDELENKMLVLREEKERDAMVIDSMARKIRFFERERGGRQAFVSPRHLQLSGQSVRGLQVARSNIAAYKRQ